MTPSSKTPVLIVGAGPAGATLALELARYGVPHRIIDKAPGATDQSRALGLTTRTLELLHRTGAGEAIAGEARVMDGFMAYGSGGRRLAELPLSLDPAISRYPHEMVLPQSRTQRLLHAAHARLGGEVEFDTAAVELDATADRVRALLRRGDGGEEWVEADWVVGGDGANSFVRRIIGDNFVGSEYEEKFLLADVTLDWPLSDRHGHLFLRSGGPIVAFPYPYPGQWRLIDTSNEAETGEQVPTIERFKRLFGAFVPGVVVREAGWTSLFRIHRRLVERYRVGRVLLMGDAAHIHSPASGQGLNTGVQDAVNLAWKLALVVKGRSPHTLLDSYEPERRPVAEGVLNDSHAITEMVLMRNPIVEHVRDALLHVALGLGPVQRRLAAGISKIGTNYRTSPIVADGLRPSTGMLRAGDRLPDPEITPGVRLSDHVGDGLRHAIVVVGGEAALIEGVKTALLARRLGDLTTVHVLSNAGEGEDSPSMAPPTVLQALGLGGGESAVLLVRPDLYLGFCGTTVGSPSHLIATLADVLDRTFVRPPETPEAHKVATGSKPYAREVIE